MTTPYATYADATGGGWQRGTYLPQRKTNDTLSSVIEFWRSLNYITCHISGHISKLIDNFATWRHRIFVYRTAINPIIFYNVRQSTNRIESMSLIIWWPILHTSIDMATNMAALLCVRMLMKRWCFRALSSSTATSCSTSARTAPPGSPTRTAGEQRWVRRVANAQNWVGRTAGVTGHYVPL